LDNWRLLGLNAIIFVSVRLEVVVENNFGFAHHAGWKKNNGIDRTTFSASTTLAKKRFPGRLQPHQQRQ
jgi:hypothetical protein